MTRRTLFPLVLPRSSSTWSLAATLLAAGAIAGCGSDPVAQIPDGFGLRAELVVDGLEAPLHLTTPSQDARLFVVEQAGRIRIIDEAGALVPEPFLDLSERVSCCGERGLLSVAFHPAYSENGFFFVNYTDLGGDTRVERYRVSGDPTRADDASGKMILEVGQPFSNHNGGLNVFGPDGMLYVALGDGGSGGDPQGHGQNPGTLLGSLLRIDVDSGDPYDIPADNPFVRTVGARDEIWAFGLRNPWRLAFDRVDDALYIADVGQSQWEEINRVPAGLGGLNYGWNVMEGAHCFGGAGCDQAGLMLPVAEYDHGQGCSITGGHVYRGAAMPEIAGHYFFADYCRGWVRSLSPGATGDVVSWNVGNLGQITSFGEDAAGELYVLIQGGRVYRLVPGP